MAPLHSLACASHSQMDSACPQRNTFHTKGLAHFCVHTKLPCARGEVAKWRFVGRTAVLPFRNCLCLWCCAFELDRSVIDLTSIVVGSNGEAWLASNVVGIFPLERVRLHRLYTFEMDSKTRIRQTISIFIRPGKGGRIGPVKGVIMTSNPRGWPSRRNLSSATKHQPATLNYRLHSI